MDVKLLSDNELKTQYDDISAKQDELWEEIKRRKVQGIKDRLLGKYVIYKKYGDGLPIYIHIDDMFEVTKGIIHIQGHGFFGEFMNCYRKSMFFEWAWWIERDISVYDIENETTFKIISKEEFVKAFNDMQAELGKSFMYAIEFDENGKEN